MGGGATLYVGGGYLRLTIGDTYDERRKLDPAAVDAIADINALYATLVDRPDPVALLALGRELLAWLDGSGGWWAALRTATPPLSLEVRGAPSPEADDWTVLRAPWEALAGEEGFLAEDSGLRYAPARRLGTPAAPAALDEHRLAITFMASSPRGAQELDYEAEELALMNVTGGIDLEVEDSGNAVQLGLRLVRTEPYVPVLHLSCHGHNAWRPDNAPDTPARPVLYLEDPKGDPAPATSDALLDALDPYRPRLLFLSACLTARENAGNGDVAHSLATSLVRAGTPAIMGWNGSVADVAATAFAGIFYDGLSRRQTPAGAAAQARRALLQGKAKAAGAPDVKDAQSAQVLDQIFTASEDALKRDWHLAQLWLGPSGGGPVVGGTRKRSLAGADYGHKHLLKKKEAGSEVASAEMFVGRRRELQDCLRALGDARHSGVLIHGMGHLGKSSLAARIASRRTDLALAVLYGAYDAGSVVEALEETLKDHPPARALLEDRRAAVLDDAQNGKAEALENLLVDLLSGPCGQQPDGRPVLLLIDDLERVLEADEAGGGRHRVKERVRPVMRAILRAFAPERSDSRLLLTSRMPFTLDDDGDELAAGLWELPLGGLTRAAQRKLALRQVFSARDSYGETFADELTERVGLIERAQEVARGHPGLQDLIGQTLVLSREVPLDYAETALAEMEAYLDGQQAPETPQVRKFLESLTLDRLIDLAGTEGQALLRAGLLFDLPVPAEVFADLASSLGGSVERLVDLGLLEPFEDIVRPGTLALAVNALVRPKLTPLDDEESAALAAAAVGRLFDSWGGTEGRRDRPYAADIFLTRLALTARSKEVVAACGRDAISALERQSYREAADLGREAIALFGDERTPALLDLMIGQADVLTGAGEAEDADTLLTRAAAMIRELQETGQHVDPEDAGAILLRQADRLVQVGRPDEARSIFEQVAHLLASNGDSAQREIAVVQGRIADILQARGQTDEALRIRQEEQLPVFERLGDVRSKAVTMGQIADILQARGQTDEALRIRQEEQLPVFERLGDVREKAVTMGQIADILEARGQTDEALRIRQEEQLPVFERLGDVRSKAVTMGKIADILEARGQTDEALAMHLSRLDSAQAIRDIDSIGHIRASCAQIRLSRGDHEKSQEGLQTIFEELQEAFTIYKQLQKPDGIGAVGFLYSQVLAMGGLRDKALEVIADARSAFQALENQEGLEVLDKLEATIRTAGADTEDEKVATTDDAADSSDDPGDLDEALKNQLAQLEAARAENDVDAIGRIRFACARIRLSRGDHEKSQEGLQTIFEELQEAFAIYKQLQKPDGIAVVGFLYSQVLAMRGLRNEALEVIADARSAFQSLDNPEGLDALEELEKMIRTADPEADSTDE